MQLDEAPSAALQTAVWALCAAQPAGAAGVYACLATEGRLALLSLLVLAASETPIVAKAIDARHASWVEQHAEATGSSKKSTKRERENTRRSVCRARRSLLHLAASSIGFLSGVTLGPFGYPSLRTFVSSLKVFCRSHTAYLISPRSPAGEQRAHTALAPREAE